MSYLLANVLNIIMEARLMRLFLILIIISAASLAFAEDNTISKEAWLDGMQNKLPAAFCEEKQYFRQCFTVTETECLKVASNATRMCLGSKQDNIPDVLVQPKDGAHWGGIVGECAGNAYETAIIQKRINSDRCNDANNWI
jgi:hypothetical protein